MNWAQFKDLISHTCLAGAEVSCWSLTQEVGWVAGSSPFNVITFFVTELAEFSEKHLVKTPLGLACKLLKSKNRKT